MSCSILKSHFYALVIVVMFPFISNQSFATVADGNPCFNASNEQWTSIDPKSLIPVIGADGSQTTTPACPPNTANMGSQFPQTVKPPPPADPNQQAQQQQPSGGQQQQQPPPKNDNGSENANRPAEEVSGKECSGGQDSQDKAGEANCKAKQGILTAKDALVKLKVMNASELESAYQKYDKAQKSCNNSHSTAASACLDNMSKDLSSGLASVNNVMSQASGSSANSSCDDMSKIMDAAKKALTAFTGACGAAKGMCGTDCGDAKSALSSLKSAAGSATCPQPPDPNATACNAGLSGAKSGLTSSIDPEMQTNDKTSVAGKQDLCDKKYKEQMSSAMQGIAGMLAGMMQGDKCQQQTAAAAVDCKDPSQAQTPKCLCAANPRLPGCDNALQKAGGSGSAGISALTAPMPAPVAGNLSLPPGSGPDLTRGPSADSAAIGGSAGAGAPLGGGSGGGSAGAAGAGDGPSGRSLNANILGGSSGGSGGGGWGSGSGSAAAEKYKAYLPGGAKDPSKLNGSAYANEITGQGKSNWDKIKERYRDNNPTLLSN